MNVKKELFCFVLFTWIMLIQCRPQGEPTVQTSQKPEPVSIQFTMDIII